LTNAAETPVFAFSRLPFAVVIFAPRALSIRRHDENVE
jgi:hypothetical protein